MFYYYLKFIRFLSENRLKCLQNLPHFLINTEFVNSNHNTLQMRFNIFPYQNKKSVG